MRKRVLIYIAVLMTASFAVVTFQNKAYVVPVIMYHSIDNMDKVTKLSVSPESFARQMEFLHRNNYNIVGLDKVVSYMEKKRSVPRRTLAITFDDGFYNNYLNAYPVLKRLGITATIFVIVDKIGTPGYLGWKEIKEMSDSGIITIGSHTLSHKWLPAMGSVKLSEELNMSKRTLEEGLGKKVGILCYPIGAFDERVERATKGAGYYCAVATSPKKVSSEDIYAIKRIKISRTSDNLFVFWIETSGYYNWVKDLRDD